MYNAKRQRITFVAEDMHRLAQAWKAAAPAERRRALRNSGSPLTLTQIDDLVTTWTEVQTSPLVDEPMFVLYHASLRTGKAWCETGDGLLLMVVPVTRGPNLVPIRRLDQPSRFHHDVPVDVATGSPDVTPAVSAAAGGR